MADEAIRKALANFGGVRRRFTRVGDWNGAIIIDDYGLIARWRSPRCCAPR